MPSGDRGYPRVLLEWSHWGHQHQPWSFMVLSCLLPPLSYPNGQNNCSASPCPAGSLTLPLPSEHSLRVLITAGRNSRTISTKVTSQAGVEMPFKGPSIWHRWTFFAEVIQLISTSANIHLLTQLSMRQGNRGYRERAFHARALGLEFFPFLQTIMRCF